MPRHPGGVRAAITLRIMTRNAARLAHAIVALALVALPHVARAQAPATLADSAAIRATALDYIEGWYTADSTRMRRALHPALVKRIVSTRGTPNRLVDMTADRLVAVTAGHPAAPRGAPLPRRDVRILDVFGNAAVVRVDAAEWVDFIQMGRLDGRWVIVNVLWEMRPQG